MILKDCFINFKNLFNSSFLSEFYDLFGAYEVVYA